jgi:hypothetical protein
MEFRALENEDWYILFIGSVLSTSKFFKMKYQERCSLRLRNLKNLWNP